MRARRASHLVAVVALLSAVGCGDAQGIDEKDGQVFCMYDYSDTGRCFPPATGGAAACEELGMPITFDCRAEGYTEQCVGEDAWVRPNYPCDFYYPADEPSSSQCASTGGTCVVTSDCCGDRTCVDDGTRSQCYDNCTSDSQCASGCCAPLEGGGGVCADAGYCRPTTSPNRCSECLSTCRGLPSCCTGTGCICDDEC